jgi:hypothetical protein
MGIFGNINFPSLPNAYPRFFVVIVVSLDAGTHGVQLQMLDPSGQPMLPEPPTVEVRVEMPGADTNLVIDFNNLPFNRAGIHQVQLLIEGRLVRSIPLGVQGVGGQGAGAARA